MMLDAKNVVVIDDGILLLLKIMISTSLQNLKADTPVVKLLIHLYMTNNHEKSQHSFWLKLNFDLVYSVH